MRKYLLAAVAAVAIASPASAQDSGWYAGIEGGLMIVEDTSFDYSDDDVVLNDFLALDHGTGFDVDVIGGYDFGMVRLEAEAAYKRASIDEIGIHPEPVQGDSFFETDGDVSATSAMVNLLLDFTGDGGWSGYVGPGVGLARVKYDVDGFGDDGFEDGASIKDSGLAWQAIIGVRKRINPSMEVGLKYRYFNAKADGDGDFGLDDGPFEVDSEFRSHSLLASLIFSFAPPPPPPVVIAPPPPPAAPATQTCPDGTVILATEVCPVPPPPPPPPPAGERG